jgi:hypothetical protein
MTSILWRIVRVVQALIKSHAHLAREELGRDANRLLAGLCFLAVAAFFAGVVVLLLEVALVSVLRELSGASLFRCLVAAAGINSVVAVGAALLGRARLRAPVLRETRAMLAATATALKAG